MSKKSNKTKDLVLQIIDDEPVEAEPTEDKPTEATPAEAPPVAPATPLKKFVCIRTCQWGPTIFERRLYFPDEIIEFHTCPNHHFVEYVEGEPTPLDKARKRLDELNAMYGPKWDLEQLERQLASAELFEKNKQALYNN